MPTTITPRGRPCCGSDVPPASSTAPPAAVPGEASPPPPARLRHPRALLGITDRPLQHGEPAQSGGIEQGLGLADPAAHRHRGQVGRARRRRPGPPALVDEVVDPAALEELGLAAHGVGLGQLVDGHVGGDVLVTRRGEVVAAPFVAPVRPQPLPPREAASSAVVGRA